MPWRNGASPSGLWPCAPASTTRRSRGSSPAVARRRCAPRSQSSKSLRPVPDAPTGQVTDLPRAPVGTYPLSPCWRARVRRAWQLSEGCDMPHGPTDHRAIQVRARFCRRCGSALPDDGQCAPCAAREQARNAFIIPRPSQLGRGSAKAVPDPVDDLQPLFPERHSPQGDSSAISSGFRAKLAAMRSNNGIAAATRTRSPDGARGAQYVATSWGPRSAWREPAKAPPVEPVIAIAAGLLSGVVVAILLR